MEAMTTMCEAAPTDGLRRREPDSTLVGAWLAAMSEPARRKLVKDLVRTDLELSSRLTAIYARNEPASRIAMLLMFKLAQDMQLGAGELIGLMSTPSNDLIRALEQLLLDQAGVKAQ